MHLAQLLDLLNAYETLWFFGRIRGITERVLTPRIERLIAEVGLTKHAHRACGNYSGGNKRKLSLAVALIGDPKLLLLVRCHLLIYYRWLTNPLQDEPSSGMDPEARRNMWNVISRLSERRTVILTTHSMEVGVRCVSCTRLVNDFIPILTTVRFCNRNVRRFAREWV